PTQTSSPQGVPDAGLAALALTVPVNTPNGSVPNVPLNPIARPHGHRKPKPHKPAKPHHAVHRKPHPLASLTGTTPAVVSAPSTHASLTGAMAAVVDAPPSPIATETAPVTPPSSGSNGPVVTYPTKPYHAVKPDGFDGSGSGNPGGTGGGSTSGGGTGSSAGSGTQSSGSSFGPGRGLTVGPNVNISMTSGQEEAETAIAVNPTNTKQLFASAVVNTQPGMFAAFSTDGGLTWTGRKMDERREGLEQACCDPSFSWDQFGNLFGTYINANVDSIVVVLSTDGGQTFKQLTKITASDQPTIITGAGTVWVSWNDTSTGYNAAGATVTGPGTVGTFSAAGQGPTSPGGANFGDIAIAPA